MMVRLLWAFTCSSMVFADLPIHCSHKEAIGTWEFTMTAGGHTNQENCGYRHPDNNRYHFGAGQYQFVADPSKAFSVSLKAGSLVTHADSEEKIGTWTMVYDEGFEINIDDSKYFAFFDYNPKHGVQLSSESIDDYVSDCKKLRVGWYHGADDKDFGCHTGRQVVDRDGNSVASPTTTDLLALRHKITKAANKPHLKHHHVVSRFTDEHDHKDFEHDYAFIEAVNKDQSLTWTAKAHSQFADKNVKHMRGLLGHRKWKRSLSHGHGHGVDRHTGKLRVAPASIPHDAEDLRFMASLPDNWDWRNINGVNYVDRVVDQGSCGSCYAIASVSVLQSRLRIKSQNKNEDKISSQDILSCSTFNQGCEGGYPYLVFKHGEEYGLASEDCLPYEGSDSVACSAKCAAGSKYKTPDYRYVGGYYGGCNEARMMKEIHEKGPIVVAFEAPGELFYYHSGVFSGDKPKSELQPKQDGVNNWEQTNHAVVCVGWGVDPDQGKYWIVKNEWGKDWGNDGYFQIKRGTDECGIESMAVAADVAPYNDPGTDATVTTTADAVLPALKLS